MIISSYCLFEIWLFCVRYSHTPWLFSVWPNWTQWIISKIMDEICELQTVSIKRQMHNETTFYCERYPHRRLCKYFPIVVKRLCFIKYKWHLTNTQQLSLNIMKLSKEFSTSHCFEKKWKSGLLTDKQSGSQRIGYSFKSFCKCRYFFIWIYIPWKICP